MKTLTVDNQKRVRIPEARPGQKFSFKNLGNGVFKLTEVEERDVPILKPRKVNGRWMGADVKLDRKGIVESIREDRER